MAEGPLDGTEIGGILIKSLPTNMHLSGGFILHIHAGLFYLFGGAGVGALVSCVVGCSSQVHLLGRGTPFPCGCGLCCLNYVHTLGSNSLFILKFFN